MFILSSCITSPSIFLYYKIEIKSDMFYKGVYCFALNPLDHGNYSQNSCTQQPIEYSEICELSCLTGYDIVGNSTLSCTQNGNWTSTEPYCHGKLFLIYKFK